MESAEHIRSVSVLMNGNARQWGNHDTIHDYREWGSGVVRCVCHDCGQWWPEAGFPPEECDINQAIS